MATIPTYMPNMRLTRLGGRGLYLMLTLKTYTRFAAAATVLLGLVVLWGWISDSAVLRSVFPHSPTMKVNTAIAFVLSGVALYWLSSQGREKRSPVGISAAIGAALVGGVSAVQSFFDIDLGIDQFLMTDYDVKPNGIPGRMSMVSAVLFVVASVCLLTLRTRTRLGRRVFVALTSLAILLTYVLAVAFLYQAPLLFQSTSIALHSDLGFILLFSGIIAVRPDLGLLAIVRKDDSSGALMRSILLWVALVIPALGWIRLQAEVAGYIDKRLGLALFATANVVLLTAVLWLSGQQADVRNRQKAEKVNAKRNALLEFGGIALQIPSNGALLEAAMNTVTDGLPFAGCVVLERAPDDAFFSIHYLGLSGRAASRPYVIASDPMLLEIANRPEMFVEDDYSASAPEGAGMPRFRSLICSSTVIANGRLFRLLVCAPAAHAFVAEDADFVESLVSIFAVARERVNSSDQLRKRVVEVERLEQEAVRHAQILESKNRDLEKADRAKSAFLAMMSHELRTPMAGLLGMAELLLLSGLNAEQEETTRRLIRSGNNLLEILNDILDLSKLDADRMVIEKAPFKMSEIFAQLADLFGPVAADKKLELVVALPQSFQDHVVGDAKRIRQVLTNLLNNAFKFTERGQVVLTLEQAGDEGQMVDLRIKVADTGIGIPEDKIGLLFQPFVQAETSTSRKYGGTGLGLSICRRLLDAMGGEISVSSELGRGSTFSVALQLAADRTAVVTPAIAPAEAKPTPVAKDPARRVLLAEDNETTRVLITQMLKKKGHEIVAVENGQLALEQAEANTFDIVLMDMHMPVMDGSEAMQKIRTLESAAPGRARLPIVALTADIIEEHQKGYLDMGADMVIGKPVNWPQLFDAIRDLGASVPDRAAS